MPRVLYFSSLWTVDDTRKNPQALFVFGDNDLSKGKKGQAIIRGVHNSIGIPTKKKPAYTNDAYYTDSELEDNKHKIDAAFACLLEQSKNYEIIFLPENGLGTGLAQLPTKAPLTFAYLNEKIADLVDTFT